ncbi:origin recognition complex subunit 4 isoform X2 [Battus philenor]|uniref:origin recognition complex subunit 4 isoform X2 n=1 Tax=Battus philenor TaxID=42288 RepID=UPI0035CF2BC0
MYELNLIQTLSVHIKVIRKYLKLKILEDNVQFHKHFQEKSHVYNLIKRVVSHGESHSVLIIGPRGCGKTTLINSVLHQLSSELDLKNDSLIVKLNGLLHQDDKVALRSITAQMQLENAVGDRVFGTFAENLSFLLSCLQSGADRRCKSITNRLDVMEMLEKRVKSRFSHRHIFLFPNENTETYSDDSTPLIALQERLIWLLSLPMNLAKKTAVVTNTPKQRKGGKRKSIVKEEQMDVDNNDDTMQMALPLEILAKCKTGLQQFRQLESGFIEDWNSHIKSLVENQGVVDALEKLCYYTVNEQILRNILFQVVSQIKPEKPYIEVRDLVNIIDNTVAPEHKVKLLQSLSILELSLVIAMKHGMEIFDGQPMNFEMVLHRYTKFVNANSSTQTVPRPVVLKAFEHLQELEVIMPVRSTDSIYNTGDTTTSRVQKEYKLYTLSVSEEDLKEAVKTFKALPTEINHWFNNSVI